MFYLAAAVSDFYIPASEIPEHKIQSSSGPLQVVQFTMHKNITNGLFPCQKFMAHSRVRSYHQSGGPDPHLPHPGREGEESWKRLSFHSFSSWMWRLMVT